MRNPATGRFETRDFTGHRSGSLTMVSPTGAKDKYGYSIWNVRCDCGTEMIRSSQVFTRRQPLQSCGCGKKGRRPKHTHQHALFEKHRFNAKYRNLEFTLSQEQHAEIITSPCAYCGAAPSERPHPFLRVSIISNGIDRVDSSAGYRQENCVPCCPTCNVAKSSMSFGDFKAWIERAYHHLHPAGG